jgi:hypothetical protein
MYNHAWICDLAVHIPMAEICGVIRCAHASRCARDYPNHALNRRMLVRTMNAISNRFSLITALLACVGIALGATTPANADPNAFGDLSCSCHQLVAGQHRDDADQIMQGIQQGLSDPHAPQVYTER